MSFLANIFSRRPQSSNVAKDRLQILLAHERGSGSASGDSDLIRQLHKEIMEVIARHVAVDQDKVQIKVDRSSGFSMLEIDVEVPQELSGRRDS